LIVAAVVVACAVCAYAVPPEVRAFEADVRIENSLMPFPMDSHCYWDSDQLKYRVDSEMFGAKNIDISDYNASIRYIIDSGFGQDSCKECFLDDDMNPMMVPPLALPDGTDVVNGETCDIWRLKWPMLDWSFCTQQHEPYAVLQSIQLIQTPGIEMKTVMTFSNILVYHPPAAVFEPNNTMCKPPKCEAPVDIALLVDGSGSISSSDFSLMKKFATLLATNITISEDDGHMSLVQFASYAQVEIGLSDDDNAVLTAISSMSQMSSSTNMDAGLDTAFAQLQKSQRSTNQVLIMFTDGEPDSGNDPVAHAQTIKDAGVEIYTVGVGSGVNPDLLKKIASEDKNPLQPHYLQAASFTDLLTLLANVVSAACKGDNCANPSQ